MSNQVVRVPVPCETAEEFLNALSPVGDNFKGEALESNWLYRGQGQDYPLIPSLFRRDDHSQAKLETLTKHNIEDFSKLIRAEFDFLVQFFEIADRRGLILPDDSQELRSHLTKLKMDDYRVEQSSRLPQLATKVWSLAGLAQHYGIPTRLLDWTRQSYIAAFFAAENANRYKKDLDPSSDLVVWAFHFPDIPNQDDFSRQDAPVHLVTAPSATNTNLKAQQGVFTWLSPRYTNESSTNYPSLDNFLEELALKYAPNHQGVGELVHSCSLQKFTLPISETKKLLFLLAKMDITMSSVFPGYHSIISDLQMRRSFE